MEALRFIVWIMFAVLLATISPSEKLSVVSAQNGEANAAADGKTEAEKGVGLSDAASSLGQAVTDSYKELAAIKYEEYQLAYKALRMSLGFLTNLLGRSVNGLGTTVDLLNSGLGAARTYGETGAGFLVDTTRSGLRTASGTLGSIGEATKGYGKDWIGTTGTDEKAATDRPAPTGQT